MAWAYTEAGKEISRPDSEYGMHVEGPITAADWKVILEGVLEELIEQMKREAREGS
jgi:hypothetical protein